MQESLQEEMACNHAKMNAEIFFNLLEENGVTQIHVLHFNMKAPLEVFRFGYDEFLHPDIQYHYFDIGRTYHTQNIPLFHLHPRARG